MIFHAACENIDALHLNTTILGRKHVTPSLQKYNSIKQIRVVLWPLIFLISLALKNTEFECKIHFLLHITFLQNPEAYDANNLTSQQLSWLLTLPMKTERAWKWAVSKVSQAYKWSRGFPSMSSIKAGHKMAIDSHMFYRLAGSVSHVKAWLQECEFKSFLSYIFINTNQKTFKHKHSCTPACAPQAFLSPYPAALELLARGWIVNSSVNSFKTVFKTTFYGMAFLV